jgi:prolipoprotein diacylglyceryltransferase
MHKAVGEIFLHDIVWDFVVFVSLYWLLKFKNKNKKCAMIKYKIFPIKALEFRHVSA